MNSASSSTSSGGGSRGRHAPYTYTYTYTILMLILIRNSAPHICLLPPLSPSDRFAATPSALGARPSARIAATAASRCAAAGRQRLRALVLKLTLVYSYLLPQADSGFAPSKLAKLAALKQAKGERRQVRCFISISMSRPKASGGRCRRGGVAPLHCNESHFPMRKSVS